MGRWMAGMLVAVLWGAIAAPVSGQSLGEVARQEAARRERIKASGKVLTNADLPASAVLPPAAAPSASADESAESEAPQGREDMPPQGEGTAASSQGAGAARAPAAPKDDEDGWTQRAALVNKALGDARTQVRQLRALSDRLSLEMQASDPAVVARATTERDEVRAQLAAAESQESGAAAARQALEQEARVAGVPPAWIQ